MYTKYFVNLAAALIPLIIGSVWYHPKIFGGIVMKSSGASDEKMGVGRTILIFVLAYAASYYIAGSLRSIVIHQYGLLSMLANHPEVHQAGTELNTTVQGLLDKYGTEFRTFKHGALHGAYTGLYFITPVFLILTLFERKRWSYLAIHGVYWIICLALMGGVVCQYMPMTYPLVK
ncbi:MAG: hypothetical protein JWO06_770 [Bacteroidota bacterium]|nr:hypothetical protein [Bacteroidota bacterium]